MIIRICNSPEARFDLPQSYVKQYRHYVRFNAAEAEVLYPENLRERLRRFYEGALEVYNQKPAGKQEK